MNYISITHKTGHLGNTVFNLIVITSRFLLSIGGARTSGTLARAAPQHKSVTSSLGWVLGWCLSTLSLVRCANIAHRTSRCLLPERRDARSHRASRQFQGKRWREQSHTPNWHTHERARGSCVHPPPTVWLSLSLSRWWYILMCVFDVSEYSWGVGLASAWLVLHTPRKMSSISREIVRPAVRTHAFPGVMKTRGCRLENQARVSALHSSIIPPPHLAECSSVLCACECV